MTFIASDENYLKKYKLTKSVFNEKINGYQTEILRADDKKFKIEDLIYINDLTTSLPVNELLWKATLDVLDFMSIKEADPFGGVISTEFAVKGYISRIVRKNRGIFDFIGRIII